MDSATAFGIVLGAFFAITLAWPLNVPLMALAYKIRHGNQPLPMDGGPFWLASTLAALALTGLSLLPVLAGWWLPGLELLVFLAFFFFYIPLAAYLTYWIYGLDEPIEGLSTLAIYLLVPGFPLLFVFWWTGLGRVLVAWWSHRLET
jgi:uncharacterized oligopeptide transporter (OPT) family protein